MREVVFASGKCQESRVASSFAAARHPGRLAGCQGLCDWLMLAVFEYQQLNPAGPLAACLGTEKHLHCLPLAVLECCYSSFSGTQAEERPGHSSNPLTCRGAGKAVQPHPMGGLL